MAKRNEKNKIREKQKKIFKQWEKEKAQNVIKEIFTTFEELIKILIS